MLRVLRQDRSGQLFQWAPLPRTIPQPNSSSFSLSFIRCQTHFINRRLLLPSFASFPNTLCAHCISHLLPHDKLSPNLLSYKNTHLLSHTYCGSRIWMWLSQVLRFRISPMAAIKVPASPGVLSEAWLQKGLWGFLLRAPVSCCLCLEASVSPLLREYPHRDDFFLTTRKRERETSSKMEVKYFIVKPQKWQLSIFLILLVKSKSLSQPTLKDYTAWTPGDRYPCRPS